MGTFVSRIRIWAFCLFALPLLAPTNVLASHSVGADLSYACLGNNRYQITLNFYRDCFGIQAPTSPSLNVLSNSCGQSFNINLSLQSQTQVSPICPSQLTQTTCYGGNLPGIEQYVYTGIVTLPAQCADWVISYTLCCRNAAITNLSNPASANIYIEAHLNNTNGLCDNSPIFTTLPTPYYCTNNQYNYNHGGIDVDGDSLVFTLTNPLTGAGQAIGYVGGHNPTNPLTITGLFQFNTSTGQMTFTPSTPQNSVLDVLVQEYRNGVLIGSTMRDMQIVVLNCNNVPPVMTGINFSSPTNPANFITGICAGQPLCFDVDFTDPTAGNTVNATWNAGIPGATFTVTNNGTTHAVGHFCWTPSLNDVGAHNFTVTLRNNACPLVGINIKGFTINVSPSGFTLALSKTDLQCNGGSNGTATVSVSGAVNPTYHWSNGGNTATVTGLAGGWYRVTVTDNGGCGVSDSVQVLEPPAIRDSLGMIPTPCHGVDNGTVFVYSVSGGSSVGSPITHVWSVGTPNTADTVRPLASGNYYITFTDNNGCTKVDSVFVTQPGPITITTNASSSLSYNGADISCHGKHDGQITVNAVGGATPYVYNWSSNTGGQNSATVSNLGAGTYMVTLYDNNGCNNVAQTTLVDPAIIVGFDTVLNAFHGYDVSCFGSTNGTDSVLAFGGTGALQYSINGSAYQNGNVFTGLGAGSYTVVVKDLNGCTDTLYGTVHQPPALAITAIPATHHNGFNVACNGGGDGRAFATVTGGTPGYLYEWDDQYQQNRALATNLVAGTYNITVIDTNGCTISTNVTLTQPPPLTISHTVTNVLCYGANTGTANVTVGGGVAPYQYNWFAPLFVSTPNVTGLKADTAYVLAVADTNECYIYDTVKLSQPPQLLVVDSILSNYNGRDISCYNGSDGIMGAFASGGTGAYTYAWPNIVGSPTTATVNGLSAGAHPVVVTDANGCTATATNTLVNPPQIVIADSVIKAYHGYDVSCFGFSDGRDSITLSGGTGSYQYSVQGGTYQLGNVVFGLAAGNYTIEVKDANGCISSKPIIVNQPPPIATTTSVAAPYGGQNISCFGANDGTANANPSGGVGGYTYVWNDVNVQTTQQANNLVAGNYTVTVRDANGCSITGDVNLTQPPQLIATIGTFTDALCNGASSGSATVVVTGGNGGYTYSWNSNPVQVNTTATNLPAGAYVATVRDANNCVSTVQVIIGQPTPVVAFDSVISNYHGQQISCHAATDGIVIGRGYGGTPPYTFNWTPGMGSSVTGAFVGNVKAGSYGLTVTDAHGCIGTAPITLTDPPALFGNPTILSNYNGYEIKCHGDHNGVAFVQASGGTQGGYTYLWHDGNTSQSNSTLSAGAFDVIVTDINNCTATTTVVMREPDVITFPNINGMVQCNGLSNGTATATSSGGVPGYNYTWGTNPPKTGTNVTDLAVGTYDVTVTDLNSCKTTSTANIGEPPPLKVQIGKHDPICYHGPDGKIFAAANGGIAAYQYHWSNSLDGDTIVGVFAGQYNVTTTDANGCTTTASIGITEPPADSVSAAPLKDTIIFGQSTEVITSYTTVATGPVTYSWEPSTGLNCNDCAKPTANPLETTVYTLRMVDALGCTAVTTTTVNVKKEKILFIPNVFSPNGDQQNDVFYVYGAGITELELKVFNRWGDQVFESHDVTEGWNGTFMGKTLDPAVFVYYAKVKYRDNTEKTAKGSVTLLR